MGMSERGLTVSENVWHSEAFAWPEHIHDWEIAGGGFVHWDDFLSEEAQKMGYGPLFVYLFRRFGPSEWGSDDYKQIACWMLTTPNPDVVLMVSPCVCGGRYPEGYPEEFMKEKSCQD